MILKYKSSFFTCRCYLFSVGKDLSDGRSLESGDHSQERRFTASACSNKSYEFTGFDIKLYIVQCGKSVASVGSPEYLGDTVNLNMSFFHQEFAPFCQRST